MYHPCVHVTTGDDTKIKPGVCRDDRNGLALGKLYAPDPGGFVAAELKHVTKGGHAWYADC